MSLFEKLKVDLCWNIITMLRSYRVANLAGNGVTLSPASKKHHLASGWLTLTWGHFDILFSDG